LLNVFGLLSKFLHTQAMHIQVSCHYLTFKKHEVADWGQYPHFCLFFLSFFSPHGSAAEVWETIEMNFNQGLVPLFSLSFSPFGFRFPGVFE